jgi:glycosyltransferase involved in cell wall biosynthesis
MKPLISVIIPTYQHAAVLPRCLDSVLAQTHQPVEIIVVDDGSTDNTQTVLEPYRTRVAVIQQTNQGANPARNAGLVAATGEYVIFCDADVTMATDMLAKLLAVLTAKPEVSYAYCGFWFGFKHFRGVAFDAEKLRRFNFIHTSSLVRRSDFPGFDNTIKRLQDWDVWLTMLEQHKTGVLVPETLFRVSIDGASRIGSSWLPSFVYRLPWHWCAWQPLAVRKYEAARKLIRSKHKL